jgi:hypothetical protein
MSPRTTRIVGAGAAGLVALTALGAPVAASSHREAPAIAFDPSADITDLYAFVSPDKPDTATLIANFTGFQEPGGGPNFYPFNPDVLYWIKVDNTGDGVEDITYTFRFATDVANPDSFLYSGYGPIGAVDSNVTQSVTVERNGEAILTDGTVAPPNIGPRTTPKYGELAQAGIHELSDGTSVFTGQRDDPFFADVASIFDLGGLRPFNEAHLIPLDTKKGTDSLAGTNVNTVALQVPIAMLTNDGTVPAAADAANAVIGVWGGASRQSMNVDGGDGDWVQVSRLGNPLINEVIIPVGTKDAWNASSPADDAQYESFYLNPELAAIVNTIYPTLPDARTTDRSDLVLILGQGVPGLNQTNAEGLYDMLRLNLAIPPTTDKPNPWGPLAGDNAGFPNGRRLSDDVVDVELRAVADGYGKVLADAFGLPNLKPNNQVGDGCNVNDKPFLKAFPYAAAPHDGYRGGTYRATCQKGF